MSRRLQQPGKVEKIKRKDKKKKKNHRKIVVLEMLT
jgi:hypothetical protein